MTYRIKGLILLLILFLTSCSGVVSAPAAVTPPPTVTRIPPTPFPTAYTPVTPTTSPIVPSATPTSVSSSIYYMIVVDASVNMSAPFDGKTSLDAARQAVEAMLDGLEPGANYGLVTIGGSPATEGLDPCNQPSVVRSSFSARNVVSGQVAQIQPVGGGSLNSAFTLARQQFESLPADTVRVLILVTDKRDECLGRDEWKGMENLSKVMEEAGLEFHSEMIVLDETDDFALKSAADRIGIWSKKKITIRFAKDFSALQAVNQAVVQDVAKYVEQVLAQPTATPVKSSFTLTADPSQPTSTVGASSYTLTPEPGLATNTLSASSYTLTPKPGTATSAPTITFTPVPRTETPTLTPTITRTPTPTKPPFVELVSSSYRTTGIGCQVEIGVKVSGSPATGAFHVSNSSNSPEGEVFQEVTLPVGGYGDIIVSLSGDRPETYLHEVWFEANGVQSNRLTDLKCPFLPTATPTP